MFVVTIWCSAGAFVVITVAAMRIAGEHGLLFLFEGSTTATPPEIALAGIQSTLPQINSFQETGNTAPKFQRFIVNPTRIFRWVDGNLPRRQKVFFAILALCFFNHQPGFHSRGLSTHHHCRSMALGARCRKIACSPLTELPFF